MAIFDISARRLIIEPQYGLLSQRKQCRLLGLNRSGLYYEPREPTQEDLLLMKAIDKEYIKNPYYGRRRMTIEMRKEGFLVGEKRVRTAMRSMGLEAIYPKPKLSMSNKEHKKYPYWVDKKEISRSNQVWAADITYVPLLQGFGYLFAIMDWYSRFILEWQISNMLDTEFCLEALERALSKNVPEIFNTDQGVQFTSNRFTKVIEASGAQVSMDGKGRAFDNIMVERLWRSVKYENIYPNAYENLAEVKNGLQKYFTFYNEERPHQGLSYKTPMEVYYGEK